MTSSPLSLDVVAALRSPFVPTLVETLDATGYLSFVWPQVASSVETLGFLRSAWYMGDMATDEVVEAHDPVLTRDAFVANGVTVATLDNVAAVLEVFHWVQPQLLLLSAALTEAFTQPRIGGQGVAEPRSTDDRERIHLRTRVSLEASEVGVLPEVARALHLEFAPDLYRALVNQPGYLDLAWTEMQHLSALPPLRRRSRALYYYARSSSRFLAHPIEASTERLMAAGLSPEAIARSRAALESAASTTATMMVHCSALRAGLGTTDRLLPPRT